MPEPTSYQRALQKLNCRRARPATSLADMKGSDDMEPWLGLLGYDLKHLESLNIIHVAGTNGKGSTCTAIARLLQAHGEMHPGMALRVGLYTSPHILHVRERICVEGQPISEELFARRFWEIDAKLPDSASTELDFPRYLQTLCLLSFHVFITAGVNVAVYETHMGGEYDATNVIPSPVVTAISSIADDHLEWLGPERSDIAWHKGGIFKPKAVALTVPQDPAVLAVLERRAKERGVTLNVISGCSHKPARGLTFVARSMNHALAIAAYQTWVSARAYESAVLDATALESILANISLPGRFQVIYKEGLTWYLDGGHNVDGVEQSALWFYDLVHAQNREHAPAVLMFAHNSRRDPKTMLHRILTVMRDNNVRFKYAIVTSYSEGRNVPGRLDGNARKHPSVSVLAEQAHEMRGHVAEEVFVEEWIEDAVARARRLMQMESIVLPAALGVLVTGSLKLVGSVIRLLNLAGSSDLSHLRVE